MVANFAAGGAAINQICASYGLGLKVFELALDIKYPSTNTWSTVSVRPGTWKVVVTDAAGAELSSVSFTVK